MTQVILEEVKNEDKVSKNGKPYVSTSIKVKGEWRNGFGGNTTKNWAAGMTVECELYEEEYNGKIYKKFKVLGTIEKLSLRIDDLEKGLKTLTQYVKQHVK